MSNSASDVRGADWRFLLHDARPSSVVVLRHRDSARVEDALTAVGLPLVDPDRAGHGGAEVVVCDPDADAVERALSLRATDGSIVVEVTSRRARRRVVRHLRRAGLSVATYGCWPTCADATRLVPLDHADQLRDSALSAKNRGRRALGAVLCRVGLGAVVFTETTVVATDGPRVPSPTRVAFGDGTRAAMTLLTPRFGTSRHVIALTTDDTGRALVTKTPRLPDDDEALDSEARGLLSLDGPVPPRPTLVADTSRFGQRWLVATRVVGAPLARRHVARQPDFWIAAAHDWLRMMPAGGSARPCDDGRFGRLLQPALDVLAAHATAEPEVRELLADAERAVAQLGATELPTCAEHGDFRPPNLIIERAGSLAAVDWELAEPNGFPMYDLLFFHDYVGEVVPGHRPMLLAAAEQFAHHHELDPALLRPLTTMMRARQLANVARRRLPGSGALVGSDVGRAWLADLRSGRSSVATGAASR